MQVTTETTRIRWVILIVAWCLAATLVYLHTSAFKEYIGNLDGAGLRGAPVATTPLRRICPTMYADAQMWVRHALALSHGAGPQIRYTYVDNAPFGREIHWDSGFAWLIVFAGWLRHVFTGESFKVAIEQAMAWYNLPLLLGFIVILSLWVARRAGAAAGAFVSLAMVGNGDFFSGFSPNYVDHHGVLSVAVFGLVVGATFMGVGFWRQGEGAQLLPSSVNAARRAAIMSAIFGAVGMWVSAATLIPAIAMVGISGAFTLLFFGRRVGRDGLNLAPDIWRLWGNVGGAVCFGFYLLEYFPNHLGFRLEVNHPAYAAGWWGGAEIIAQIADWRAGTWRPRVLRLSLAAAAILVTPLIIAVGGERVFVVFDPFITRLSRHVAEGISTFAAVKYFGPGRLWVEVPWTVVSFGIAFAGWWAVRVADRIVVTYCTLATAAITVMAVAQIRWWSSAAGPQICLILIGLAALVGGRRRWVQWAAVLGTIALLCLFDPITRIRVQTESNRHKAVDKTDAYQPIYRDIAATLRASQPTGDIVLLASPNASVAISYYGEFKSIGTLYWENLAGTKAAAEIFSAQSPLDARRLCRARGITHVAMISQDNFLSEYFDLLHPQPGPEKLASSFGYQLLVDQNVPLWLESIPYDSPRDVPVKPERALLYKTHFATAAAETAYEAALQRLDANDLDGGLAKVEEALALAPRHTEFLVVKSNLLLAKDRVPAAFEAAMQAIDTAVPSQKLALCSMEAATFYHRKAHPAAVLLYRKLLEIQFDPSMANNLAWLLATSTDDKVRNGPEALRITEKLVQVHQDQTFLNAYAAALAECGRYADAATIAARALEATRAMKDENLMKLAEARLATYRQGKPWRE